MPSDPGQNMSHTFLLHRRAVARRVHFAVRSKGWARIKSGSATAVDVNAAVVVAAEGFAFPNMLNVVSSCSLQQFAT